MKRVLLIAALLMGATAAFAQDYTPTTTWPYANADFAAGRSQTYCDSLYADRGTRPSALHPGNLGVLGFRPREPVNLCT